MKRSCPGDVCFSIIITVLAYPDGIVDIGLVSVLLILVVEIKVDTVLELTFPVDTGVELSLPVLLPVVGVGPPLKKILIGNIRGVPKENGQVKPLKHQANFVLFLFHLSEEVSLDILCESSAKQMIHLNEKKKKKKKPKKQHFKEIFQDIICCSYDWHFNS